MTDQFEVVMRPAIKDDLPGLESLRAAAFQPIFNSFKKILGTEIYNRAQAPEDNAQCKILSSSLNENSKWHLYAANKESKLVGFIMFSLDCKNLVGEIGLNAVHPDFSGFGIGTYMYKFAVKQMKNHGMQVATVATGADPGHVPARMAYQKAGFNVEIPSVWMCMKLN